MRGNLNMGEFKYREIRSVTTVANSNGLILTGWILEGFTVVEKKIE